MASIAGPAAGGRLPNRRIRLLLALSIAAMLGIALRALYLQTVDGGHLSALATHDQEHDVALPAPRGGLYDRTGRAFAISDQATTLAAYTGLVRDKAAMARTLAPIVGVPAARLMAALTAPGAKYVYLARRLPDDVIARVRAAPLGTDAAALDYPKEERRIYPQGAVGSQLVGLTSVDETGLAGLELSLDPLLRGHVGRDVDVMDPAGQTLRRVSHRPAEPGHDVRLTVDRDIQAYTEQVLAATRASQKADAATAIVLDTRTGGVLAMASAPGIPAAGYSAATPDEQRIRAITDQYEPGSTFKAVTFGAALEEGVVRPDSSFDVPYSIRRYDKTVTDSHYHPTERWTARDILERSSNVGTITIADTLLGQARLAQWIDRFGFGHPTGIELPGERFGTVLPLSQWSGTSILNIPIGEGVAVTALQMASLYQAIANKGMWIRPHVVARVYGAPRQVSSTHRVLSEQTDRELVSMLRGVVDVGTGTEAQIPGYTVAGKTGTTPKIDPKTGKYDGATYGYVGSFVGFAPARRPRVLVLVVVDHPRAGNYYGGLVAAPAFRQIMQNALQVLQVPPDDPASIPSG